MLDRPDGNDALAELFWQDEVLQAMYWLRGEALAEGERRATMCLSVPREVIRAAQGRADVLVDGRTITVLTALPDLQAGDFVLLQAGIIVERLDAEDAQQILALFQEMAALMDLPPDTEEPAVPEHTFVAS